MLRRVVLIANRHAGSGEPPVDRLATVVEQGAREVSVHWIDAPRMIWPSRSALRGADAMVVAGGDGTINRVLPWALECEIPLGVIPCGTANDFARTLQIPTDPEEAAELILAGKTHRVDVAQANDVLFLNAAGIGVSAAIGRHISQQEKSLLGVLAYARHLWRALSRGNSFVVEIDGDSIHGRHHAKQVIVANGRHYGGGMTVREDAALDDGTLTVLLVRPRDMLTYVRYFLAFRTGRYRPGAPVLLAHARRLSLAVKGRLDVSVDGEIRSRTPVDFRVHEKALEVFVP